MTCHVWRRVPWCPEAPPPLLGGPWGGCRELAALLAGPGSRVAAPTLVPAALCLSFISHPVNEESDLNENV